MSPHPLNKTLWQPDSQRKRTIVGWGTLALLGALLLTSALFVLPASAHTTHAGLPNQMTIHTQSLNGTTTRLEVFATIGVRISHKWSDDQGVTWSPWEDLPSEGHVFRGRPSVISDGAGLLTVVAEEYDTVAPTLWMKTEINGGWSTWSIVPGLDTNGMVCLGFDIFGCINDYYIHSAPALTSWGPGRMELFVNALNGNGGLTLLHTWADNYTWSGTWETLGTGMQGDPAAMSWGPGRTDVFEEGTGGEVDHKWFANGQWTSGWEHLAGIVTSSPTVTSLYPGSLDVVVRGTDGHPYYAYYPAGGPWQSWPQTGNWSQLDGQVYDGRALAATSRGSYSMDLFEIGTDLALYYRSWAPYSWSSWQMISPTQGFDGIAATAWVPFSPPPTPTPAPVPTRCTHNPCTVTP